MYNSCYLVPPIRESGPTQPFAAFPQYKYRHPLALLPNKLSPPFYLCAWRFPPGRPRSLSCRLRLSVSVIPRSHLDPHQAAGQPLRRSFQLCRPPCREHQITFAITCTSGFLFAFSLAQQTPKVTLDGPLPRSLYLLSPGVLRLSTPACSASVVFHLAAIPCELLVIGVAITRVPAKCSPDWSCRSATIPIQKIPHDLSGGPFTAPPTNRLGLSC